MSTWSNVSNVPMPADWVALHDAFESKRADLIGTAAGLAAAVQSAPGLAAEWAARWDAAYAEYDAAYRALAEWKRAT